MKTFADLDFGRNNQWQTYPSARLSFPNGYGVSVRSEGVHLYPPQYEVAVLHNERLCYTTNVCSDVVRFLTEADVTELMRRIQSLPPKE